MSVEGSLRFEAEEVQIFYAGGTGSLWYFLVSWLFFLGKPIDGRRPLLDVFNLGRFWLDIVWVLLVLPGLRRISSGFGNQKRRLSLF